MLLSARINRSSDDSTFSFQSEFLFLPSYFFCLFENELQNQAASFFILISRINMEFLFSLWLGGPVVKGVIKRKYMEVYKM